MSDQPINYEAVLADLEARKEQIEAAIAAVRLILGQAGPTGPFPVFVAGLNFAGSHALVAAKN